MTIETAYGTRPASLPRSLVRLTRADNGLLWVGRAGVELLDFAQHHRYQTESLDRFPHHRDGTIDWAAVDPELVLGKATTDFDTAMPQWLDILGDHVVIIWSLVVVPTVLMAADLFAQSLSEISATSAEFWIYSPDTGVLVENTFAGQLTAARVP
ncbi:hypothetical protein JOD54_003873 [Actinokineospora baliensis]|uniref:hypothetical protein n=1 Tax=Actinokineospora baliensis TaxID=547056 RepID=UPI001956D587|nr:hypothetical protein [Actinokineospora baliensis]MBM7773669.1 hypothetical protein [Actinokineospora baliensis]